MPRCPCCEQIFLLDRWDPTTRIEVCGRCKGTVLIDCVPRNDRVDTSRPPRGVRCSRRDGDWRMLACLRHLSQAGLQLITGLFWNGFLLVYVLAVTPSTLHLLGLPQPAWLRAHGFVINPLAGWEILFARLFLSPFILGALWLMVSFVLAIAGRTEVHVTDRSVTAAMGVGSSCSARVYRLPISSMFESMRCSGWMTMKCAISRDP